jgi:hypothetical protein
MNIGGRYNETFNITYANELVVGWDTTHSNIKLELLDTAYLRAYQFHIVASNIFGQSISPVCNIAVISCSLKVVSSDPLSFSILAGIDKDPIILTKEQIAQ